MKKLKLTTAFLLALTVAFAQETTVKKSFQNIDDLNFESASGDCTVTKSEGNTIDVEVTFYYDKEDYEPIFKQSGSNLIIKENYKKKSVSGKGPKWTISMPSNIESSFNIGSGDLKISNIDFEELNGNLGSGNMILTEISGETTVNIGSGDLNLSTYKGKFKGVTGSGDLKVNTVKGSLSLIAGSGNISIESSKGSFEVINGSGDIDAKDIMIKKSSSFISGSGDAEIILAAALAADVSIISGSGDAILDFDGNDINARITMKASKRNGDIDAPFDFTTETEEGSGSNTVTVKTVKKGNGDYDIDITTGSGEAAIKK